MEIVLKELPKTIVRWDVEHFWWYIQWKRYLPHPEEPY